MKDLAVVERGHLHLQSASQEGCSMSSFFFKSGRFHAVFGVHR